MTTAERITHNDARRWQYLPVRIANTQGRVNAYRAALAREEAEPRRDHKRIAGLRRQIAAAEKRIAEFEAQR